MKHEKSADCLTRLTAHLNRVLDQVRDLSCDERRWVLNAASELNKGTIGTIAPPRKRRRKN